MQCSDCREDFLGTIPALTEDYARPGDVQLLYRHYSNSESPEELSFYGAEAAAEQGYGWQYIYLFFRNQEEAERFGDRPGLPRLDRRRRRGTERPRMGRRPGRQRRPRRRHLQAPRRLRGTRPRSRHPRPSGDDRQRPQRHRNAPGRPVAGSDRTGHRSSAVIGAPGFEPGTSPTRTVRATRLRHAPRAAIISEPGAKAVPPPPAMAATLREERCSSKSMTRKITLILALALVAIVPSAAHAYLPAGLHRRLAAERRQQRRLRADAGSRGRQRAAAALLGADPGEAADRGRRRLVRLRSRGRARRRSRNPGDAVRLGLAGMGGAAGDRPAGEELLAALGLDRRSCAKRPGATGPTASSGRKTPSCPFLPIRRWEIWNEENIVTFADRPDPVDFAKLIRISGRVLHRVDPGVEGDPRRPLRPAAADAAERRPRATSSRASTGRGNVKPYFDGVALHPYVARAKAMGAQIEQPAPDHAASTTTPRRRLYVTELGWGSRQRPDPLGARPVRVRRTSSRRPSRCSRPSGCAGGSVASGGSPGPTKAAAVVFCRSAGLLTERRKAKPAWYRFNAWTGGDPDTVPRGDLRSRPAKNSKSPKNRRSSPERPRRPRRIAVARLRTHFEIDRGVTRCLSPFPIFPTPTTRSSRTSTRRRCASTTTSTTRPTSTKPTPPSRAPSGPTATSTRC